MNVSIGQHALAGTVPAVASKSVAHRVLMLAALCDAPTEISCNTTSQDIEATMHCLEALGARIEREGRYIRVTPCTGAGPEQPLLDCSESGSTLRFLLPVVCALGRGASLTGHGRLAERPLSPLYEELCAHGCTLSPQGIFPLVVEGRLGGGTYLLPGNVSSQYATGLMLAAPLLAEPTEILVRKPVQSAPYLQLTIDALAAFGVRVQVGDDLRDGVPHRRFFIDPEKGRLVSPGSYAVEGDWSNASFWFAADALGSKVAVKGLSDTSAQGDRAILSALASFGAEVTRSDASISVAAGTLHATTIDVGNIPDLVPPIAAVAARAEGTTHLTNAGRLRLKESDRLATVTAALRAFGVDARATGDELVICGGSTLTGCTVDAANDHRIAMMASVLAAHAEGETTICGAECVSKSYPAFYQDFERLGGIVRETAEGSR